MQMNTFSKGKLGKADQHQEYPYVKIKQISRMLRITAIRQTSTWAELFNRADEVPTFQVSMHCNLR